MASDVYITMQNNIMKYILVNGSTRWSHVSIDENLSTEMIHFMEHYHKCNGILKRQMEPDLCIMEKVSIIIHQKDSQPEHYEKLYNGLSKQQTGPVYVDKNVSMKNARFTHGTLKM